ncbi:MAG: hypothetical protein ACERKZ_18915 [Lachnotalea sp.]
MSIKKVIRDLITVIVVIIALFLISQINKFFEQQSTSFTNIILHMILPSIYFIIFGIFIVIVFLRSLKNNVSMAIVEFMILGLLGLYLSFQMLYYYILVLDVVPKWMVFDPEIPMYFGGLLFGVEVVQLVINVRKYKRKKANL